MSIEDDGVPSEQAPLSIFAGDSSTSPAPPFSSQQNGSGNALAQTMLFLLRNRVEHLGGSFEVISGVEQGTQARVSIPYVHHSHVSALSPAHDRLPQTLVTPLHYHWPGLL